MYKKKVLICDDSGDFSDEMNTGLGHSGYEIKHIPDANQLINAIAVFKPDLIFISVESTDPDIHPDLILLKNRAKGVPLIMLS